MQIDQIFGPEAEDEPVEDRSEHFRQRLVDLGFPIEAVHVLDGEIRLRFTVREFERFLNRLEDAPKGGSEQIHQNTSLF